MIFITLGSQKFQFNRLLKKIDDLIEKGIIVGPVYAQIGYSDYIPKNYTYEKYVNREKFAEYQAMSDIVITHGGTGAIIGAVKQGKKVIAVPRLAKYGEHVDNHQLQIIEQFKEQNLICGLNDCSEIEEALKYVETHNFNEYVSNTQKYIDYISEFIENN